MLSSSSKLSLSLRSVCKCGRGPGSTRALVWTELVGSSLSDTEGEESWPSCPSASRPPWGPVAKPGMSAGASVSCDIQLLEGLSDAGAVRDKPNAPLQLCSGEVPATASSRAGLGGLQNHTILTMRATGAVLAATMAKVNEPVVASTSR